MNSPKADEITTFISNAIALLDLPQLSLHGELNQGDYSSSHISSELVSPRVSAPFFVAEKDVQMCTTPRALVMMGRPVHPS